MPELVKETAFSVAAPEPDAVNFAWSPDGRGLCVLSFLMRRATYFAVPTGERLAQIGDLSGVAKGIAFAAEGIAVIPPKAETAGGFALWDVRSGQARTVAGPVRSSDFAANLLFDFAIDRSRTRLAGLHYAQADPRGVRVAVYDASTWRLVADHKAPANALAISPDGSRLALASGGGVEILRTDSGAPVSQIRANVNDVRALAWDPQGERLATGAFAQGYGPNPATGKIGPLHDSDILQLWSIETKSRIHAVAANLGGGVESIDFSSDLLWLAATFADGTCRLWNARTWAAGPTLEIGPQAGSIIARFSPDSNRLAILQTNLAEVGIYRIQ